MKQPKTLRDYKKYHKMLWQGIVDEMLREKNVHTLSIKSRVFHRLFSRMNVVAQCFACDYYRKFKRCFLVKDACTVSFLRGTGCLSGLFDKLCSARTHKKAILLAKRIRDMGD
jgi:hypothetical protein